MSESDSTYIHGYSKIEQERLLRQAEFMEYFIYRDVNFSQTNHILEVGSGVGAQTQILLRRFPTLKISCIDLSEKQIQSARTNMKNLSYAQGRYEISRMAADKMTFPDDHFQGAFLCWVLEHVKDPLQVLSEVRRVLRPGAKVYITEVMNFSFFLDPYCPSIWKFWMELNDYQYERGGDPFVGVKLGTLLRDAGYTDVSTQTRVLHADKRDPALREKVILHWQELVTSAIEELLAAGRVTKDLVSSMQREFESILKNPNAIMYDAFMQATARVP